MERVAVLVDGGFFIKRYRSLRDKMRQHTPSEIAKAVHDLARSHCEYKLGPSKTESCSLSRILYYDCPPFTDSVTNPLSKQQVDFGKSSIAKFQNAYLKELVKVRKLALRRGELRAHKNWVIHTRPSNDLLKGIKEAVDLNDTDIKYNLTQKMVDIKIGLDIATLAYEKLVERIVLVSGDSDFVPAAKLARTKGIDFLLDPLWSRTTDSLNEHVDGIRSVWPRPNKNKIS